VTVEAGTARGDPSAAGTGWFISVFH